MPAANVDELLDQLLETTETLLRSPEKAPDLLEQRKRLIDAVKQRVGQRRPQPNQLEKLNRALALGEQARQPLTVQRETALVEMKQLKTSRQVQESFKPYRPNKPAKLNIQL